MCEFEHNRLNNDQLYSWNTSETLEIKLEAVYEIFTAYNNIKRVNACNIGTKYIYETNKQTNNIHGEQPILKTYSFSA